MSNDNFAILVQHQQVVKQAVFIAFLFKKWVATYCETELWYNPIQKGLWNNSHNFWVSSISIFFYGHWPKSVKCTKCDTKKRICLCPTLFCFDSYPNLNSKSNFIKLIYGGIAMENYLALCKGESRSEEN